MNRTDTADEAWAANMGSHILNFDKSASFWDDSKQLWRRAEADKAGSSGQ